MSSIINFVMCHGMALALRETVRPYSSNYSHGSIIPIPPMLSQPRRCHQSPQSHPRPPQHSNIAGIVPAGVRGIFLPHYCLSILGICGRTQLPRLWLGSPMWHVEQNGGEWVWWWCCCAYVNKTKTRYNTGQTFDEKTPHRVETARSVRPASVSTAAAQALTKDAWLHAELGKESALECASTYVLATSDSESAPSSVFRSLANSWTGRGK